MSLESIVGHKKQKEFLSSLNLDQFHHSWIFYGKNGIGKRTTLLNFINQIIEKKNFHNNIRAIECDKKTSFDEVREIINYTNLTNANNDEKIFVIIDNADYLNYNSFNALLKTIEEPPINTIIVLILENIKAIPKTVISRCNLLKFEMLSQEDLRNYCKNKKLIIDENFFIKYQYLIDGSIDRLKILMEQDSNELIKKLEIILDNKEFKINDFESLYSLISKDFFRLKFILIDTIYNRLKNFYIKNFSNERIRKLVLNILSEMQDTFNDINDQDRKEQLLLLLVKFTKLKQ